jgi:hypothetical protein
VDRREFLVAAAAAPLALSLAPDAPARRPLGGMPTALVTADTESHVAAVDVATARIVRRIETLAGPRSIESVSERVAVVAHTAHGAVSLIDGPALAVRHVLGGFDEPRYTAAHPDGRHAYVTDSGRGDVVALDVVAGKVAGRARLGGPARHVSLDPSGRLLWVALGSKAEEVAVLDVSSPLRPRVVGRIRPPYLAHDVGFAPGGHVWVTSGDRGTIGVYGARARRLLFMLPADAPPQHVTFAGGLAFVTSGDDGTLRVHQVGRGRLLRETAVPVGSYNVQRGAGRILTPSLERGTLCMLSEGARLLARVQVAASSHDACVVAAA